MLGRKIVQKVVTLQQCYCILCTLQFCKGFLEHSPLAFIRLRRLCRNPSMGSWQDYERTAEHSSVIRHVSRSAARPGYLWGKDTSVLGMKLRLCRDFGVPYGLVAPQGPYPCAPDVFGNSVARAPGNENSSLAQYCSGLENRALENSHHFRAKNNTIINDSGIVFFEGPPPRV